MNGLENVWRATLVFYVQIANQATVDQALLSATNVLIQPPTSSKLSQ
jgi:hypothetical protein